MNWVAEGISCNNVQTAKIVHKFLREAILDRHLPVTKVIGFKIKSSNTFRVAQSTYIARHKQIGESYPEIMNNLSDKVWLDVGSNDAHIPLNTGMNTLENTMVQPNHQFTVDTPPTVLYVNPNICRCLQKTADLEIILKIGTGYSSMAANSKEIDSSYFPCSTDFSVAEFFRILPFTSETNVVPIRYYNGATPEVLKQLLNLWKTEMEYKVIERGDRRWLSAFNL